MAKGMTLDTRQFDRAMVQYAAASGKDFKDVANRQLLNMGIQGSKVAKNAQKQIIQGKIESLKSDGVWQRMVARTMSKKGAYTRRQAAAFSKKMARARIKAIGFLRFFFLKMSQEIAPYVDGKGKRGKKFAGFGGTVYPATAQRPTASVTVSYDYKRRGQKTAATADKKLQALMSLTIAATIADMMKYVDKKMGKTAKKYSARGTI